MKAANAAQAGPAAAAAGLAAASWQAELVAGVSGGGVGGAGGCADAAGGGAAEAAETAEATQRQLGLGGGWRWAVAAEAVTAPPWASRRPRRWWRRRGASSAPHSACSPLPTSAASSRPSAAVPCAADAQPNAHQRAAARRPSPCQPGRAGTALSRAAPPGLSRVARARAASLRTVRHRPAAPSVATSSLLQEPPLPRLLPRRAALRRDREPQPQPSHATGAVPQARRAFQSAGARGTRSAGASYDLGPGLVRWCPKCPSPYARQC